MAAAGLLFPSLSGCSKKKDAPPPPPVVQEQEEEEEEEPPPAPLNTTPDRYSDEAYKARVEEDARAAGIASPDLAAMKGPFPHFKELKAPKIVKSGKTLETDHLQLKVGVETLLVGEVGSGIKTQNVTLTITNRTDKHLAYRVWTTPPAKHKNKGTLAHNAIALKPNETLKRTESLPPDEENVSMTIKRVEVLEIPPLGYYYISRLDPTRIRYNARLSEGHKPPEKLAQCMIFPWRVLFDLIEKRAVTWYDIMDFYARHDCNKYSFFKGYKWSETGPERVPARP